MASGPIHAGTTKADPARPGTTGADPREEREPAPGAALGRYHILWKLGSGGMGSVYAAYDPQLDRKVALKLLLHGEAGSGSSASARLLREAHALARVSHPNVVAVYDAGSFEGRLFVAMEAVEGKTLREWLREAHTTTEVLAMMIQAGRGLAAAHAAGIVHRDFKPENVLVGDDGRARVADFGLAHALQAGRDAAHGEEPAQGTSLPSTLSTPLTVLGARLGTPRYMSPEQFASLPTDARTDQFSFSVTLFEALYGARPFDGDTVEELESAVRGGRVNWQAAKRRAPARVQEALARGLAADAAARFPSMEALLAALEDDPRRKRLRAIGLAIGGAAVAAAAAFAGARALRATPPPCPSAAPQLVGIWDEGRSRSVHDAFASTRRSYAEDSFRSAARALDAYAAAWIAMRADACLATRVRGEQSEELMDLRVQCLAERRDSLDAVVRLFIADAPKALEHAVEAAGALPPVADCANVEALRAPLRLPTDSSTRARVTETRRRLAAAQAEGQAGDAAEAEAHAKALVEEAEATGYRPLEAESLLLLGTIMESRYEDDAAIAVFDRAVRAAVAGRHVSVETLAWVELVRAGAWGTHQNEAIGWAEHARASLERAPDARAKALLFDAEGVLAQRRAKLDDAIALGRQAVALTDETSGLDSIDLAATMGHLATSLHRAERDDEALDVLRGALGIYERANGPGHPQVAAILNNIGNSQRTLGRLDDALDAYRRSYEIKRATGSAETASGATTLANIGVVLAMQGKFAEAIEDQLQALEIRRRALGPEHPEVARSLENVSEMLLHLSRWDEARQRAEEALAIRTKNGGADSLFCIDSLVSIALAQIGQHQARAAVASAERVLRIAEEGHAVPADLAHARYAAALAYAAAGTEPARARSLAAAARATFAGKRAVFGFEVDRLDATFPRLGENP